MYLCPNRYEQIQKAVARVLKQHSDLIFPIDLNQIIEKIPGLSIVYYSQVIEPFGSCVKEVSSDGFGVAMSDERYTIYVNDQRNTQRIRFTIAHEIGHFILGHDSKLKSGRISQERADAEADFFAAKLLVPNWAIECLKIKDNCSIIAAFGVSHECACYRLNSYKSWVKKGRPRNVIEDEIFCLTQFRNISPLSYTIPQNSFQEALYA